MRVGLLFFAGLAACQAQAAPGQKAERTSFAVTEPGAPAVQGAGAMCRPPERPIYVCDFGRRQVAVCSTDNSLTYRFGSASRTELELTSSGGSSTAAVSAVTGGGGGKQTHIRFTNGDYDYIVHTMVAGGLTERPGQRSSGLTVMRGEQEVSVMACGRTGDDQAFDDTDLTPGTFSWDESDYADVWY